MEVTLNKTTLYLNNSTGSLSVFDSDVGLLFCQYPLRDGYKISDAKAQSNEICFTVTRADGVFANCKVTLFDNRFYLDIIGDGEFNDEFFFPAALIPNADDRLVYPLCEGVSIPADDTSVPFPPRLNLAGGAHLSMGLLGLIEPLNRFVLCANMTTADGCLLTSRDEDGFLKSEIGWLPEKGKWGYKRSLCYVWGEGGVTALGLAYREIAKEKGFIKPFSEKAKEVPLINKLLGAADVWVFNSDAMDMLYSPDPEYKIPSPEQFKKRREIADDMKRLGMTDVLWSIFNENVDKATVDYIKSLGFVTTFYDIYTDVIPHPIIDYITKPRKERCKARLGCWPDGVIKKQNGDFQPAWALKGIDGVFRDQHRLCDAAILDTAKKNIGDRKENYGIEGCFLDVSAVSAVECYDKNHPMTRTSAMEHKRNLGRAVCEMELLCGTEIGCEDVAATIHYNEGMMSPPAFRAPDSGRRMTHIYKGEDVPKSIPDFMLNPKYRIPLWELVFHGCVQSYWYWGDSANCCPELLPLRDRFCALYGLPQIYSFSVDSWDELKENIAKSYKNTSPLAKKLGFCTMDSFEYLTADKLVQKTEFSDGTTVTVNFSSRDVEIDGQKYPAGEIIVGEKQCH